MNTDINENKLHIFHIDMDAFYASVEEHDNPKIKGYPVIVGGKSKSGIVTTANYEARKYGIHSAMPIFIAKQKCPNGIYLPTRRERYLEVSKKAFKIFESFTNLLEPVSIDEVYMDISNIEGNHMEIAKEIKHAIKSELGLTISIGISYNKFLAKLASDWEKPDGITVISEEMVPEILLPLKVGKIHGIGPKSAEKLNSIGIYDVNDLMNLDEEFLVELMGKSGREIYHRIRGIDDRPIETTRERKSYGTETTLDKSTDDLVELKNYLKAFSLEIEEGLEKEKIYGRTITVKLRDKDFQTKTRSKTLVSYTNCSRIIYDTALELFEEIKIEKEIRLIGLTVSNLSDVELEQLSIFN